MVHPSCLVYIVVYRLVRLSETCKWEVNSEKFISASESTLLYPDMNVISIRYRLFD